MTQRTIIGIGQSNYRGPLGTAILPNGLFVRGFDLDGVWTVNPNTLNDGSPFLVPLYSIYNEDGPHQCLGLYLADDLVPSLVPTYDFVGTIGMSKGGTTASEWGVSTSTATLYGAMLGVIAASGEPPDALIVYQGEADSTSVALASQWLAKWNIIADDFQSRFNNVPIVVVELPANNPNAGFYLGWNTTRAQQAAFADVSRRRYVVQSPNTAPGEIHHDAAGLEALALLIEPILAPLLLNQATITTIEYSLTNNSTTIAELTIPGVYQVALDASNMEAGDIFAIYAREKVTSSSAQTRSPIAILAGRQTSQYFSPTVSLLDGWDLTMQKLAGLDRVFQWDIRTLWLGNGYA